MRSMKHPFPAAKLPVRGLFRVTCMIVASVTMVNVRRIARYLHRSTHPQPQTTVPMDQEVAGTWSVSFFFALIQAIQGLFKPTKTCFGC